MSQTDTETQYDAFVAATESSIRRRRLAWGIGAVAAAAAVVIALVLGGVPGLSSNEADMQLPARDRTPVRIATDFVDALAAYDATKASRDVGTSEGNLHIWPGEPSLREGLAWAKAARFTILPKDCVGGRQSGSMTIVACQFDWHILGSDHLAWVPRAGSFWVQVADGRIEGASTSMDWSWAGMRRDEHGDLPMWRPFVAWLEREHPDDIPAIIVVGGDGRFTTPRYTDESRALWAKYVDEWVASQQ